MNIDIADSGTHGKTITLSYSRSEVAERRDRILRKLSSEVSLKGFRPGKSARTLIEKRFGADADARADEELANEGFNQAVQKHGLKPIGPVQSIDRQRGDGLKLTLGFETKPAVKLPEPTALGINADKIEVSDADLEQAINAIAKRGGTLNELGEGQTIAEDDSLMLSGAVTVDGAVAREFKDLQHLVGGYPLFGKDPKEVIAALDGKRAGAELSFDTVLPPTFKPEAFAGKSATVTMTVGKASRLQAAPIDDELAKKLGVADAATLKSAVKDNLQRRRESDQHQRQIDELTGRLLEQSTVELPPKLLESVTGERREAALQKLPPDADDAARAEAERSAKSDAERTLKRFLILDAIAETYKVAVTRQDLDQQIHMAAARSGQKPEELAKRLMDSGRFNDVVQEIREAKALEAMLDLALGRQLATPPAAAECVEEHVHGPECQHGHAHG